MGTEGQTEAHNQYVRNATRVTERYWYSYVIGPLTPGSFLPSVIRCSEHDVLFTMSLSYDCCVKMTSDNGRCRVCADCTAPFEDPPWMLRTHSRWSRAMIVARRCPSLFLSQELPLFQLLTQDQILLGCCRCGGASKANILEPRLNTFPYGCHPAPSCLLDYRLLDYSLLLRSGKHVKQIC